MVHLLHLHWLCCTCWCGFWQSIEEAIWKVLTCPAWHGEYILYLRNCIKGRKNQSSLKHTKELQGNNLASPIQVRLFLWSLKIHFTLQTAVCCIIFPESNRLEWQNLSAVCSEYIVISPSFCNDKLLSPFSGKTLFPLSRFNRLSALKCPQMFS